MRIEEDFKLGFDDVLIVPKRSTLESRSQVSIKRTFKFYHSPREFSGTPIFCSNMASIAGIKMATALNDLGLCTALHKYIDTADIPAEMLKSNNVFMSIGMGDKYLKQLRELVILGHSPNICIDVPNAYIQKFVKFCADVRDIMPNSIIMAGNVVTPEMVQELIIHGGVDISKTGIGPGRNCRTSLMTGVSYPQLSAAIECSNVAHGLKSGPGRLGLICLDGGFNYIGDFAKAFVAGADFCMTASMFAGSDECCGEWKDGKLIHYGMSTHYAQEKHENVVKSYRASEGMVSMVDSKGPVSGVVQEMLGGLRSTGTYIGADCLQDFNRCGHFIKVYK